jgi:hypothetical protein
LFAYARPSLLKLFVEFQLGHIKDEASVRVSAHARLPAILDRELLDFITALVKASKVVEVEKAPSPMEEKVHKLSEFTGALNQAAKDGLKKAVIDGVINDRWLAKMVGKVTRMVEDVRGDVGYSGDIPVELSVYRETGWLETEGEKLLP